MQPKHHATQQRSMWACYQLASPLQNRSGLEFSVITGPFHPGLHRCMTVPSRIPSATWCLLAASDMQLAFITLTVIFKHMIYASASFKGAFAQPAPRAMARWVASTDGAEGRLCPTSPIPERQRQLQIMLSDNPATAVVKASAGGG